MKFKNVLSCILSLALAGVILSGCSNNDKSSEKDTNKVDKGTVSGKTAVELVSELKAGWNLGNTLDALGGETAWGNPETTQELVDAVAAKGFNTIRIPTTWFENTGKAPDYKIDEKWLKRVSEVIDYAFKNDMYVILNMHHEDEWLIPDAEHSKEVENQLRAMWKQIAEYLTDYGDHLIFEGMNEPRVKGSANEWNGGDEAGRKVINTLNKAFIETVRSTGGNNEKRLLLITTYAAQPVKLGMEELELPDDKYVGISIHAYTPYRFTYHPMESWELYKWDGKENFELDNLFKSLDENFISKGYPVIITEYGAVNKYNQEEVVNWVKYYLESAKELGIPCVWWDNGQLTSGNELFGLLNRNIKMWHFKDVADAIIAVYEQK